MGHAIIIEINSCPNACLFCANSGVLRNISSDEMKRIGQYALRQALELRLMLVGHVEISGADPIEYPKIAAFIRILKKKLGFVSVCLSTHGRLLEKRSLVEDLVEAGLDTLRIPVYGPRAEVHEAVTRRKGSFEQTMRGLDNVKECSPGMRLILTSLLFRHNIQGSLDTFKLMARYASEIRFGLACITDVDFAKTFTVPWPELGRFFKDFIPLAEGCGKPVQIHDVPYCVIGRYHKMFINHTPPPLTAPTYSIPEVYRSSEAYTPSYRIKVKPPMCKNCAVASSCDGFYESYARAVDHSLLRPLEKMY